MPMAVLCIANLSKQEIMAAQRLRLTGCHQQGSPGVHQLGCGDCAYAILEQEWSSGAQKGSISPVTYAN
jgi:hypothetical protein